MGSLVIPSACRHAGSRARAKSLPTNLRSFLAQNCVPFTSVKRAATFSIWLSLFNTTASTQPGSLKRSQLTWEHGGHRITRALFEQNMRQKLTDPQFTADISPLLATGYAWNIGGAAEVVATALVQRLPGETSKGGT